MSTTFCMAINHTREIKELIRVLDENEAAIISGAVAVQSLKAACFMDDNTNCSFSSIL